jgi:sugar/nucleoside kinase (ribokinase family)
VTDGTLEVDVCFIGNYTKDTIVDSRGVRQVDGGAFNYGANAAVRMGLRTGAITHLAEEDLHVVRSLEAAGVPTRVLFSPHSTCLRLEYPTDNPDDRVIRVESIAAAFRPEDLSGLVTRAAVLGASFRGEIPLQTVQSLSALVPLLALDAQGFVRVVREGRLEFEPWPEGKQVLGGVQILKADIVEAGILTGASDLGQAARMLQELGPREIVLTHRDGLLVRAADRNYEAAFRPRQVLGRSGRGDTCLAAYTCRRLEADPAAATLWAAALTSLKMESPGPFSLGRGAVERLIQDRY